MITRIDHRLLDAVSAAAAESPRQRKNYNFHPTDDFPAHRMLNALAPDSYIVPHCHRNPAKDETMLCLRGALGVVTFSPAGTVEQALTLQPGGEICGVDIPHGVFHSVLALVPGTVMFEAKAGPYVPLTVEEMAPWAPAEGSPEAAAYLAGLRRLFA